MKTFFVNNSSTIIQTFAICIYTILVINYQDILNFDRITFVLGGIGLFLLVCFIMDIIYNMYDKYKIKK